MGHPAIHIARRWKRCDASTHQQKINTRAQDDNSQALVALSSLWRTPKHDAKAACNHAMEVTRTAPVENAHTKKRGDLPGQRSFCINHILACGFRGAAPRTTHEPKSQMR